MVKYWSYTGLEFQLCNLSMEIINNRVYWIVTFFIIIKVF